MSALRTPLVIGNWKMSLDVRAAAALSYQLACSPRPSGVDVGIAPSFPALERVGQALAGTGIALGAQDVWRERQGAYTGEVSAEMLRDVGVRFCLVGHSERRRLRAETESDFAAKMARLVDVDIAPVYCVGETLEEREAGETERILERQLEAFDGVSVPLPGLVLAYEPVWAIGTGRAATAAMAQAAHAELRRLLEQRWGDAARCLRILYGGSVTPKNAVELFDEDDVDGGLVGGASLSCSDFLPLLSAAAQRLI